MEKKILLKELADERQSEYRGRIILAKVDGKLSELTNAVGADSRIEFITTAQNDGALTYKRSATLIMLKAIYDVVPRQKIDKVKAEFSLSKGYYCTIKGDVSVTEELLLSVKKRMRELVEADIPIVKKSLKTGEAVENFRKHGMYDKEKLFSYRRSSLVNVYSLDGFEDYYYGYMAPSTGYIEYFDLYKYDEGFVIQFPTTEAPELVPEFAPQKKLFGVLKESSEWSEMLQVETVGDLNEVIAHGKINELILVQEALQEKKLADIAASIAADRSRKFIMIAGPSSSGKTTTSYRLAIQLRAHGMAPHQISLDNYFVNREDTPLDANGNYNFECLEALDVEQFNKDMTALLNGKSVEIPSFNFKIGKREYNGEVKRLGPNDVLVIEGIHGLNEKLSYSLPKESRFKIYLSALTQLNIDEHNRIPTTDGRLLRRMVRDARTRGTIARKTIAMWSSVRRGEEENIFPFQEEADVMFNSALIYELAVLKQYAEPLLFGITPEHEEYAEAKRLLKFLDYFLGVGAENIPINSIAREFVGGSCFNV
ncbi:MAG: nucleoside kinase [Butyrivibrio sp.]|nr:nucleoside kinase [Butyrivibrio sp.]